MAKRVASVAVVAVAGTFKLGDIFVQESDPKLTHTITRGDLLVTVTEQGTLESSNNTEIKCKVRGFNTVIWVIDGGTEVQPGDYVEEQIESVEFGRIAAQTAKQVIVQKVREAERARVIEAYQGREGELVEDEVGQQPDDDVGLLAAAHVPGHVELVAGREGLAAVGIGQPEGRAGHGDLDLVVVHAAAAGPIVAHGDAQGERAVDGGHDLPGIGAAVDLHRVDQVVERFGIVGSEECVEPFGE